MADDLLLEEEQEDDGGNEWLVTSADMSLILLTFFILLYSMSDVNSNKFNDSFTAVKQALGSAEGKDLMSAKVTPKEAGALMDQVALHRQMIEAQKRLFADMQYFNSTKGLDGVVGATLENGTITLRIPSEVLFPQGSSDLADQGKAYIRIMKDFFIKHPDQRINIRGFTDDVPPKAGARFRDNWELSALRAVNVLRYLVELGLEPNRLTATGLADLEPLFPNSSDANRARNRRVEFALEKRVGR